MDKAARPKILPGPTYQKTVGCGHLYITINGNGSGPREIFAMLGKSGGCSTCQNEALTRSVTLGLRGGIPALEFVNELKGIQCPNPKFYPEEEKCLSCPDAIGQALQEYLDEHKDHT